MSLRIRKNGDVLCAAIHAAEDGDTYIPDDISEILTGCTGKVPVLVTDPEPIHSIHGKWWWAGSPGAASVEFATETLDLAQQVLDMPSMPRLPEAIAKWANGLAADISKGKD